MRKPNWRTAALLAAAFIGVAGIFSATTYAKEMYQTIIARFEVGNMQITQYDKELPQASQSAAAQGSESGVVELPVSPKLTVDEARSALGLNFPAPTWMPDYEFVNCVLQGSSMAEVQYKLNDQTVNFLISKGGENGIGTTDDVKTEVLNGTTVYYANGIVIWENKGFTVELYSSQDFDTDTLSKIIDHFAFGTKNVERKSSLNQGLNHNETSSRSISAPAAAPAPMK